MDFNSVSINLFNNYRIVNEKQDQLTNQISTGERTFRSFVDPSGLAISVGMKGQIRGIQTAVQNCEDTLNLINLADTSLSNISSMLMRIRDLGVKMANEATASTTSSGNPAVIIDSDQREMYKEMGSLAEEIKRQVGGLSLPVPPFIITESAIKYNEKELFFAAYDTGQAAQVGPNADSSNSISVVIPSLAGICDSISTPAIPFPGTFTAADFKDYGLIQIDEMDLDLDTINDVKASLGAQARGIQDIVSDLNKMNIALSDSESEISDTNMAEAVSSLKQSIITKSTAVSALLYLNEMRKSNLEYLTILPVNQEKEIANTFQSQVTAQ